MECIITPPMVTTSKMEKLGDMIVHSNDEESYFLATNPGLWVVAAATSYILGNDIPDFPITDLMRAAEPDTLERYRATNQDVFCEYQAIRHSAERHHVPPENVFIIIHSRPAAILELLSQHTLPAEIPPTDTPQTRVMIDDVWPHTAYADYVAWFHSTHPNFGINV